MDLWNALQDLARTPSSVTPLFDILGVVALVLGVSAVFSHHTKSLKILTPPLGILAIILAAATAFHGINQLLDEKDAMEERRSDLIADYLLTEHDLIVLDPIKYQTGCTPSFIFPCQDDPETDAQARAVTEDGTVVVVGISWLALDTAPHDPDAKLPAGFDPITVTITPATDA